MTARLATAYALLMVSLLWSRTGKLYGQIKTPASLAITLVDGRQVSTSDFSGKVVALGVVLTRCPHCGVEMQMLDKLMAELTPAKFQAIGVAIDEDAPGYVADFIKKNSVVSPVGFAIATTVLQFVHIPQNAKFLVPIILILDTKGSVCAKYGFDDPVTKYVDIYLRTPLKTLIAAGTCKALPAGAFPASSTELYSIQPVNPTSTAPSAPFPTAVRTGDSTIPVGMTRLAVHNNTRYTLTLTISGANNRTITIVPKGASSVLVPAGNYGLTGRVSSLSVLPFSGSDSFTSQTENTFTFYIQ